MSKPSPETKKTATIKKPAGITLNGCSATIYEVGDIPDFFKSVDSVNKLIDAEPVLKLTVSGNLYDKWIDFGLGSVLSLRENVAKDTEDYVGTEDYKSDAQIIWKNLKPKSHAKSQFRKLIGEDGTNEIKVKSLRSIVKDLEGHEVILLGVMNQMDVGQVSSLIGTDDDDDIALLTRLMNEYSERLDAYNSGKNVEKSKKDKNLSVDESEEEIETQSSTKLVKQASAAGIGDARLLDVDGLIDETFSVSEHKGFNIARVRSSMIDKKIRTQMLVLYVALGGGFSEKKLAKRDPKVTKMLTANKIFKNAEAASKNHGYLTLGRIALAFGPELLYIRFKLLNNGKDVKCYCDEDEAFVMRCLADPAFTSYTKLIDSDWSKSVYLAHAALVKSDEEKASETFDIIPIADVKDPFFDKVDELFPDEIRLPGRRVKRDRSSSATSTAARDGK